MRGVGEDDAARGGRGPGRPPGEPALPQRQVQRGQLARELDVLDLHDGRARAGAAWVLKVGGQRVGLAARREVLARRREHARGGVPAVRDWEGEISPKHFMAGAR